MSEENLPQNKTKSKPGTIRRLFQHSAIYSISTSVQRLQGLILTPIYTSTIYLPELSEYSNYGLIYTFIAFMNFVYLYGMDSALLRYFFLGKIDRSKIFSSTFLLLTSSGVATSLLLVLFAKPLAGLILFSEELSPLIRFAAIILLLDSLGNLPYLILRAEERAITFTSFRLFRFTSELIFNIIFVVILRKSVMGIIYANICAALLNFLVTFPFTLKYFKIEFDLSIIKKMLSFGLPFLPNGIAFMALEMLDRFLITKFLGKDEMAFYHANYKFATLLLLLIIGFRHAWQPFFLKIAENPNARQIYARVLNYYLLAAATISIFITFFIEPILTTKIYDNFYILGQNYWQGIPVIPWVILSYLFYGIYIIFTPAFYITKKSKFMMLFTGSAAIISLILNILLLPKIGLDGAIWARLCSYAVMTILIFAVSQKIYPIPVEKAKSAWLLMSVGLAYIFYYILEPDWTAKAIVFVLIVLVNMVIFFKSERNLFNLKILKRSKP